MLQEEEESFLPKSPRLCKDFKIYIKRQKKKNPVSSKEKSVLKHCFLKKENILSQIINNFCFEQYKLRENKMAPLLSAMNVVFIKFKKRKKYLIFKKKLNIWEWERSFWKEKKILFFKRERKC